MRFRILEAFAVFAVVCTSSARSAHSFSYPSAVTSPPRSARVDENLFRIYYRELREIGNNRAARSGTLHARNLQVLAMMRREPLPDVSGRNSILSLSKEQARLVLDSIREHPIVGDQALQKYDPLQKVGFCFGRAAYVHLELLRQGVHPASIGKVFAIGRLQALNAVWDFHVATVVRGPGSQWWAVDPLASRLMTVEEWMKETEKQDLDPAAPLLRFYFTDAVKFQPDFGAYGPGNLNFRHFQGYFTDLGKWFDDQPSK